MATNMVGRYQHNRFDRWINQRYRQKLAVASSPKVSVCVWMFIGNAPPLERDVKAKPNTEDAFEVVDWVDFETN